MSLNNPALGLSTRYKQFGTIQHLDEAIVLGGEALAPRPQRYPLRSSSINSLSIVLSSWYRRLGEMQDLGEAIILDLCLPGHPITSSLGECTISMRQLPSTEKHLTFASKDILFGQCH